MGKFETEIVAIPAERIAGIADKAREHDGFAAFGNPGAYKELLQYCVIKQRGLLENDPSYKQIIPYLVLLHDKKIFYYIRPGAINEQRLANKLSIGVGGHVELEDVAHADETIQAAVLREAKEEVGKDISVENIKPLGFISSEVSDVERVHLGILMLSELEGNQLTVADDEIGMHGFATAKQMEQMMQDEKYSVENWTQIAWQAVRQYLAD